MKQDNDSKEKTDGRDGRRILEITFVDKVTNLEITFVDKVT